MTHRRWFFSGVSHQYAESTPVSFTVGMAAALARSREAVTSGVAFSGSGTQNSNPSCTTGSKGPFGSSRSWSRGPSAGARRACTGVPGSAVSARWSVSARSRLMSPEGVSFCRPSSTEPSSRRSAGQAIGSTVARVTEGTPSGRPSFRVSSTVAAGTSSRSATQSHSPGRRSNGRCTSSVTACAAARPWHAL
ncbi:hypothetical protein STENM223S_09157 [Streptomyces tendae]